ncbi:MAG: hypothetical protein AAFW82_08235, partial [Pseudomonadota bacterium]
LIIFAGCSQIMSFVIFYCVLLIVCSIECVILPVSKGFISCLYVGLFEVLLARFGMGHKIAWSAALI